MTCLKTVSMNRSIRCPHYGRCLDRTIADNRPGFDCTGCQHQHDEGVDCLEMEGIKLLFLAVFNPKAYLNYRHAGGPQEVDFGEILPDEGVNP